MAEAEAEWKIYDVIHRYCLKIKEGYVIKTPGGVIWDGTSEHLMSWKPNGEGGYDEYLKMGEWYRAPEDRFGMRFEYYLKRKDEIVEMRQEPEEWTEEIDKRRDANRLLSRKERKQKEQHLQEYYIKLIEDWSVPKQI